LRGQEEAVAGTNALGNHWAKPKKEKIHPDIMRDWKNEPRGSTDAIITKKEFWE